MRSVPFVALASLGALASGCFVVDGESTDEQGDCLAAYTTHTLDVFGVNGARVCDASVVLDDAGARRELSPGGLCGRFLLPAQRGTYTLYVEAPGHRAAAPRNVTVGDEYESFGGGCSGPDVRSENIVVRLEPEAPACDGSAALSFQVDLRDETGAAVCDASVVVREGAFEQALGPRPAPGGSCDWDGPVERPGSYEVTVSKAGYETIVLPSVVVAKAAGACHVTPAKIEAQLTPAAPAAPT